jgi:2-methylcitrate dehydratase PrpD
MSDETISEKLARHYSSLQFEHIPGDIVDPAKLHILDSLGCLLAGSRLEPGKLAYGLAAAVSGGSGSEVFVVGGADYR